MKLKNGFILQDVGDRHLATSTGDAAVAFNGLICNNSSADYIYHQLLNDTTEDKIVDAMLDEYEVSREVLVKDVHNFIVKLRELGFLDE